MEIIGLIAAMKMESDALLRQVKGWQRSKIGSLPSYTHQIGRQVFALVTSGMGEKRAGEAARKLVEVCHPVMLISFGIAGAVEADLEIGDVVLPENVYRLREGSLSTHIPLEPWTEVAREKATLALARYDAKLYLGTAITTGGAQVEEHTLGEMEHPVLEMETAAIADAAREAGIPLLSLRAISDGPSAPIPFDLGEMMDENANMRTGRLLRAVVQNPRIIMQGVQMRRNSYLAAEYAAVALVAALNSMGD